MKTSKHRIGLPPQMNALYIERYPATLGAIEPGSRIEYLLPDDDGTTPLEERSYVLSSERRYTVAGYWQLPIHVNPDQTLGTFLLLYDDGKIERLTLREDEGDEYVLIKPADKDIKEP